MLPGVTRREVLDLLAEHGTPVRIRRCPATELPAASGVFWTSSLSGAVPVTAADGHPLPEVGDVTAGLNRLLGTN